MAVGKLYGGIGNDRIRAVKSTLDGNIIISPNLAPDWMRSEVDKSWLLFEIQCLADLLDLLKPRDGQLREHEMFDLLDNMELL